MKKLIIFGTGDMAQIVTYYFERDSEYRIEGYVIDQKYIEDDSLLDKPIIAFENIEEKYSPEEFDMFVAIGPSRMNKNREAKFKEAKLKGYNLASYVSPRSVCESKLGENCFVGDMSVINPFVKIGDNNIIWEGVVVNNKAVIENNNYISPKVVVSSFSRINNNCILGIASIVKSRVSIEDYTLIGASCYISKDTKAEHVYGEKSSKDYGPMSLKVDISV